MIISYHDTEKVRKKDLLELLRDNNVSLDLFPYEWLCRTDFFSAPASKGYHAAYPGGLYDHCRNVTTLLLDWPTNWVTKTWSRPESPVIIGMLHDVTKIGMYALDTKSGKYIKNPQYTGFGGHGYDSACKVALHMTLTEEERACIRYHMGAFSLNDWKEYEIAIRKFPNVLFTHTADMYASKVMED